MNKTLTIALAGYSIIIDEIAYHNLDQYLQALRKSLAPSEAPEIMNDIELRIVELLKSVLLKEQREVVNEQDIQKIIAQIGTPEQINEETEAFSESAYTGTQMKAKKQLFRNPDDKIFSGVASGLAAYFGLKTIWVRILLVLLSFTFVTLIIYFTLWLIVPEAISTSDKLKMKGQPINFENIKEHSASFAGKATDEIGSILEGLNPTLRNLGLLITKIFYILIKFIGFCFIFIAIAVIGSVFMGLSFAYDQETSITENLRFFVDNDWIRTVGYVSAVLTVVLLVLVFMYLGIKCISPKTKIKNAKMFIGIVALFWFLGVMVCVSFPISINTKHQRWTENSTKTPIITQSDTIFVQKGPTQKNVNFKKYWDDVCSDGNLILMDARDYVKVSSEDIDKPIVEVIKSGNSNEFNLHYAIQIQDNKLVIPKEFSYSTKDKFNEMNVQVIMHIPKNKYVVIDEPLYMFKEEKEVIDSVYHQFKSSKIK